MNSKNILPYLGMVFVPPTYFYIRKSKTDPTQIEEIRTINSSLAREGFIKKLAEAAELGEQFSLKIRLDR